MFGIILVLVGIIWLLANLGLITAGFAEVLWPAILIILGIWIIAKPRRWKHHHFTESSSSTKENTSKKDDKE